MSRISLNGSALLLKEYICKLNMNWYSILRHWSREVMVKVAQWLSKFTQGTDFKPVLDPTADSLCSLSNPKSHLLGAVAIIYVLFITRWNKAQAFLFPRTLQHIQAFGWITLGWTFTSHHYILKYYIMSSYCFIPVLKKQFKIHLRNGY